MSSEVEERLHKALAAHPLERTEGGYRLVHPLSAGISTLRLLPASRAAGTGAAADAAVNTPVGATAVAEITAEYGAEGLPAFHATGVQRLNSWALYGAYQLSEGRLGQKAQWSIHANEPNVHFVVQGILNAFGAQLPLGRSTALAMHSAAVLKQQRAHHRMPARWTKPLEEGALGSSAEVLRQRGLAASHDAHSLWAEFPLSGDSPSRAIDPRAETALLQINLGVPHPIAGAGYRATISLPWIQPPPQGAELCRRLNELELEQVDFPPRLGAWGLHTKDDLPGYSCFIPHAEPVAGLHMAIMGWCVMRAAWLRDRFWKPKVGIALDEPVLGA